MGKTWNTLYILGLSALAAGGIPFSQTSLISLKASTRFCLNVSVEVSGFDTFDSIPNLRSLSPARSRETRRRDQESGSRAKNSPRERKTHS